MDTFPFHWDTLDASQCPRMACLCPNECHEDLVLHCVNLGNVNDGTAAGINAEATEKGPHNLRI